MRISFLLNCHCYKIKKIFKVDGFTNKNNKEHNKLLYIPDHPYRILIIGGSGPGKTNTFLSLIKKQNTDSLVDKIDLYAKELSEPKYEFLTKDCKDAGMKHLNAPNHLLSAQILWMIFMKILTITT